jgi:pilus assembly protein Flp/PilA
MRHLISMLRSFLPAQQGATAIEYALIASCISIAIVGAVTALGSQVKTVFYDKLAAMF